MDRSISQDQIYLIRIKSINYTYNSKRKSKRFYISQAEIQATVKASVDPSKTWQEKKAILLSLGEIYGKENMPNILSGYLCP